MCVSVQGRNARVRGAGWADGAAEGFSAWGQPCTWHVARGRRWPLQLLPLRHNQHHATPHPSTAALANHCSTYEVMHVRSSSLVIF